MQIMHTYLQAWHGLIGITPRSSLQEIEGVISLLRMKTGKVWIKIRMLAVGCVEQIETRLYSIHLPMRQPT